MLGWIRVRNIAVIDELQVSFEPGLNLLTGETGAGKTILIDALSLILGSRASSDLIRTGAEQASVEAGFELEAVPEALEERLAEAGIDANGEEIVVRREVVPATKAKKAVKAIKGRVAVNGAAGATSLLRDMAPFLVDIHGQGESAALARAESGLELLDQSGDYRAEKQEAFDTYRRYAGLEQEEAELSGEAKDAATRREFLTFQFDEIERAKPRVGEDTELEEERRLLAHGERLRGLTQQAYGALYEEEGSVLARLAQVWKQVGELAEIDPRLKPYLASREAVGSQLDDLALFLRDYREQIRSAPGRLDEVETRLAELERLKKKFGGSLQAVLAHRDECERALDRLESSGHLLTEIREKKERAAGQYLAAARELSKRRHAAAKALQAKVVRELRALAMEKARFSIGLSVPEEAPEDRSCWRESGLDVVELLFSANPGEDLRPLSRVGSGGELSRFMLALKSVAARGEQSKTLVFDEVDAGIGGRVAEVVGEKLKALSRSHQVICVTHLPQIASFADAHFRIEKNESRGRTVTRVRRLDRKGRVDEIARMLAGAKVTDSARKHAEQLVAGKG
jgi:DNA repair protein RecN (Recombination protein N)